MKNDVVNLWEYLIDLPIAYLRIIIYSLPYGLPYLIYVTFYMCIFTLYKWRNCKVKKLKKKSTSRISYKKANPGNKNIPPNF